jgi:hypothetical protein
MAKKMAINSPLVINGQQSPFKKISPSQSEARISSSRNQQPIPLWDQNINGGSKEEEA